MVIIFVTFYRSYNLFLINSPYNWVLSRVCSFEVGPSIFSSRRLPPPPPPPPLPRSYTIDPSYFYLSRQKRFTFPLSQEFVPSSSLWYPPPSYLNMDTTSYFLEPFLLFFFFWTVRSQVWGPFFLPFPSFPPAKEEHFRAIHGVSFHFVRPDFNQVTAPRQKILLVRVTWYL